MDTIAALKMELAEISKQLVESQTREAQLLSAGEARATQEVSVIEVIKSELTRGVSVVSGDEEISLGDGDAKDGDLENPNLVSEPLSDPAKRTVLGPPCWIKKAKPLDSPALRAWKRSTSKQLSESKNPKFKGRHWEHWKLGVLTSLNLAGLKELVLEDHITAPADAGPEEQVRIDFGNELAFQFLHGLLSEQPSDVSGCHTAREIWKKLEDTYQNPSLTNWMIVHNAWVNHRQGGTQTMESFIREQEGFVERLSALGRIYDGPQKSMQLLGGLHSRFNGQKEIYMALEKPYEELISILKSVGIQSQVAGGSGPPRVPRANPTVVKKEAKKEKAQYCYNCGDAGHTPRQCHLEILKTQDGQIISRCYNCKDIGHSAKDCPKPKVPRKTTGPK